MANFLTPIFDTIDSLMAWLSSSLKQTTESYCDIETAEDANTLVAHDGSLVSVIRINGIRHLIGTSEFNRLHDGIGLTLRTAMKRSGHAFQVFFYHDREHVSQEIREILTPAINSAARLNLQLNDLLEERIKYLARYCADESLCLVLWTRPFFLSAVQQKRAASEKLQMIRKKKIPIFPNAQNFVAGIPELRDEHRSFLRSVIGDFEMLGLDTELLEVHEAVRVMRFSVDREFTDEHWRPVLPGDKIPVRDVKIASNPLSGVLWPPLAKQIFPRDAENLDLRTCRIGDKIYSSVFIELFPQEVKPFIHLFNRILNAKIPWRISFFVESNSADSIRFKALIASILSFASEQNKLLSNANNMLRYIDVATDDAVVKLRVSLSTWAPENSLSLLRTRTAELAKAVESWGTCEVSEICGDAFAGVVSSMLGVAANSAATASVAPLSDVIYMLPITRPASSWKTGAVLFRSPDGKPLPYQPGSSQQTTWIDLFYARPGAGKSVLSNTINLGLCLAPGIKRIPRIAIIDIGPSSSGLISLLKEALPLEQQHYIAYHRLRMTPEYSINPFDTQLGARFPTPQERSFLVNFLTLLATPLGASKAYDGMSDMVGLVIDEMYKHFADTSTGNPHVYTLGIEQVVDEILEEIGFVRDEHTTWWEVTDALFIAGFAHEALLAQRYAMPLLADAASICRTSAIQDLYGSVKAPTGESLINAFSRMISGAVREYPILSRITSFDIGEAKVVALDLDEVAKSGGDAADRQTAVMYMLARYVLARHYYLTEENITDMSSQYQTYHQQRIKEIREDAKRIVYDEFHRTSKSQAVRDQVILDMREGRKWNVQIALISQSLDDFDSVMVEFATSVFIMDAGNEQTVAKTAQIFGLSETAQYALKSRVHGPREGGATFMAQFLTKHGPNTQLLTSTIGPIELWSFSTTAEDVLIRNKLYKILGPVEARRLLANAFPDGSIKKVVERRMIEMKDEASFIEDIDASSIIDTMVKELLKGKL